MSKKWFFHGLTFIGTLLVCQSLKNSLGYSSVEILLISLLVLMIFLFNFIDHLCANTGKNPIDTYYPFSIILGVLVSSINDFKTF